jgi:type IV secretory pathway VirD2 relaxase
MASRKESDGDRFSVRPAAPKSRVGTRPERFVSKVLKEVSKAGAKANGTRVGRPASTFGRGRAAAGMAGRGLGVHARRVVVKARFVVLKEAGANSVSTHLRYIERDGVTRDGQRGQAYGPETDTADLKAFEDRGRGDRHQFRFIVSAEDAVDLEDLRGFTRQLMQRMAVDMETPLDWVAVDHWDTDNPHTHIVLNGRTAGKENLVIAPDYLAHGMRMRASEIATEWLGPRTETEIRQSLQREVAQQRLTGLDRALLRQAVANTVDMTGRPEDRQRQNMLRARLQRLEAMALADQIDANRWQLAPDMAHTLTAMGEREDALVIMRQALKGRQRECVLDGALTSPVIGRIAGKGLTDELHDRGYLVVDAIDGRAHFLELPAGVDLSALPINGIVEARPSGQEKAVDKSIAAITRDGIYRTKEHLMRLEATNHRDPQATIDVHVRRLEALRRSGMVERITDGVWRIPPDLTQKAQQHDARKTPGSAIELRSHLPIGQQVRAIGATWIDRQLVGDSRGLIDQGFGSEARSSMQNRINFLTELGLAERQGQRVILARNLLMTLRDQELALVGKTLQDQTGQTYRMLKDGQQATGIYRRSIQLASGRFAMLDEGMGFSLVPWRPVIEPRLGKMLTATVRGGSASWDLGRQRGLSMG